MINGNRIIFFDCYIIQQKDIEKINDCLIHNNIITNKKKRKKKSAGIQTTKYKYRWYFGYIGICCFVSSDGGIENLCIFIVCWELSGL